jgi:excisionase family DNA binding protein
MPESPSRAEILARKPVDLAFAADYLGVSIKTVRRRISDGTLRATRIGPRAIRIALADLEELGGAAHD